MRQPHPREFLLNGILPQSRLEIGEVHAVQILVLIIAGVNKVLLPSIRLDMLAKALRADAFHHALHGRID